MRVAVVCFAFCIIAWQALGLAAYVEWMVLFLDMLEFLSPDTTPLYSSEVFDGAKRR